MQPGSPPSPSSSPPGNSVFRFFFGGESDSVRNTSRSQPIEMDQIPPPTPSSSPSSSPSMPPLLSTSLPLNGDLRRLEDLCHQLQNQNSRLVNENSQLHKEITAYKAQRGGEDLRVVALTLPEEAQKTCVSAMSDELLYSLAIERPYFKRQFNAMLDTMLGGNKELDDLRATEKQLQKFREDWKVAEKELKDFRQTLQRKLDEWKAKFGIHISLDKELGLLEGPKSLPTTVPEIIASMRSEIDNDLVSIFGQIEENFQSQAEQSEKLAKEKAQLADQVMERDDQLAQLKKEMEALRPLAGQYEQLSKLMQTSMQKFNELKKENESLKEQLSKARREIAVLDEAQKKLIDESIQKEWDASNWKEKAVLAEASLHKTQIRLRELDDAEAQRIFLAEALEEKEKKLETVRSARKSDATQKKQALDMLDDQQKNFQDSYEVQHDVLKKEEARRIAAEKECDRLREKNAAQEQKLNALHDIEGIENLNRLLLTFMQELPPELQMKFMEKHETMFKTPKQ